MGLIVSGVGIARDSLKAAQLLRDLAMKGHPWAQVGFDVVVVHATRR